MKVNPLSDYVVVGPVQQKEGSLIVVSSPETRPTQGTVLEVGPGRIELGKRLEMTVKVDDHIIFPERAGVEMRVGPLRWLIMHEYEIFGVIEGTLEESQAIEPVISNMN